MTDWISDPNLTAEEKLARFETLGPEVTVGPESHLAMPGAVSIVGNRTFAVTSPATPQTSTCTYGPDMPGAVAARSAVLTA